jgi:UDPglucose 6-dehydrogenase
MANLCEAVGADVEDLAHGLGLDHRIAPGFLRPGPGFGGSCFPKDTLALMRTAQEHGSPCRIVETVVEVNNAQRARMVNKITQAMGGSPAGKTLAVLGLSFKPDTDDLRDSPALTIIPSLTERGLKVRAHDPAALEEARRLLPEIDAVGDPYEACEGADALCLMTEWKEYKSLDLNRVAGLLKRPLIIDLRNALDPRAVREAGLVYVGVGRGRNRGR